MSTAEPPQPTPVTDDTGRCQRSAAASLEELPAPDVVVIGGSLLDEDPKPDKPKRREKSNDADWWKRGEQPPF